MCGETPAGNGFEGTAPGIRSCQDQFIKPRLGLILELRTLLARQSVHVADGLAVKSLNAG